MSDPTGRFSRRAGDYARYRPGYPPQLLGLLREECGLTSGSVIADVGSGTGLLARLFLENGNKVLAVEPNEDMRWAGEELLGDREGFVSVAGTAEGTTLDGESADFVTAGQAFHWFDPGRARAEFARVLKPGGWVVLVWNLPRKTATAFHVAYERLLWRHAEDYGSVTRMRPDRESVAPFFGGAGFVERAFDNRQAFDLAGLEGRLLSSSYVPGRGEPGSEAMLADLRGVFEEHESGGEVVFEYDTSVYYGRLNTD